MTLLVDELTGRLAARADAATRAWWERYLRGAILFRGVPMAGVRQVVHELRHDRGLDQRPREEQLEFALMLFAEPHAEDKLAGILVLAELLLDRLGPADVPTLAQPFERRDISDWSTCDWYCVKVLGRMLEKPDARATADAIASWRNGATLWQRRAAAVAFVRVARRGETAMPGLVPLVLTVCAGNARDRERFSQTSVGWVLRELSHAAPDAVAAFVEEHRELLSREARNMATARLPPELRHRLNPHGLPR
ncbi:MAG: DNA alkylation repair protein [Actinomycetota bacterium]|nr:DNA alkylation repair protein [Actinomycetota bacterium]